MISINDLINTASRHTPLAMNTDPNSDDISYLTSSEFGSSFVNNKLSKLDCSLIRNSNHIRKIDVGVYCISLDGLKKILLDNRMVKFTKINQ